MEGRGLIVDLFAGGGGVSLGIKKARGRSPHVAVNHWPLAIEVHEKNHPETRHYTANVYQVRPEVAVGGRRVWILWASPDCTTHSVAKGGVPVQQKIRMLPYSIIPWAAKVQPELIIVENVQELRRWGPLRTGKDGKRYPDPAREGETFRAWIRKLERLGYQVEHRVLTASDYGAPTKRKRLFVIARRDGLPIVWPEKTHGSPAERRANPRLKPWRTAAECIDWSLPCPSIFGRKRPLKPKTLRRIFLGLKRFVLENPDPYIVPFVGAPLDTVLAVAARFGLVAPHLVKVNHGGQGREEARGEQLEMPLSTVTAARRGHGLVAAHLVRTAHGEVDRNGKRRGKGEQALGEPIPTLTASKDFGLVAANLIAIDQQSTKDTATAAGEPLHTVVTKNRSGLVTAFLAKNYGGVVGVPFDGRPLDTVTATDHHSLAAATLVKFRGECSGADPAEPAPTVTASGTHIAEVRAFLVAYYGQDHQPGQTLTEPMRTITAKARLGIVTVHGVDYQVVDIGFRMLRSHELLRATCGDYADEYDLSPAKTEAERVRLIGNMVPPKLVEAIVAANTSRRRRRSTAA
jgi:DNA (cytosine-5)-methyltransferase 1